jgi:hypothetical protein
MVSTVNIGGHKINKWWLIGGAGGAVGVWYLYKRSASGSSSSGSATAGGTDPSATDPVTGLPYSEDDQVDPITGLEYLQEAQEYGSVQAAEEMVTSGSAYYGQTGTGGVLDSGSPTLSGVNSTSTSNGSSFSTNAAWAQAVTAGLVQLGYSSTDVAAALGLFFAGSPLGSGTDGVSYAQIVQAAEAEFGPPPVGSYSIITEPSSGGSTTTTGTGTGTTGTGTGTTGTGTGSGGGGESGTPNPGGPSKPAPTKLKGITLNQPHAITNAQGTYLFQHPGNGGVYWKATDGSYVQTFTGKGVGQLYTGAQGWAYLQKKGKA